MPDFVLARNRSPRSRLPYVLSLPLKDGEVVLATRDVWPRTGDLYCHPADDWPEGAEEVLRVPVERCWRSGAAVHLVLRRTRERRSIFVWTQARGRQMIFWRSAQSMRGARPGVRVPGASGLERATLAVAVDVQERYPWRFADHDVATQRRSLPVGDYAAMSGDRIVAVIERRRIPDLATSITSGTLTVALSELAHLPRSAIVVEGRVSDLVRWGGQAGVSSGWLLNALAALQAMHPSVTWMFVDTRKLAEDWGFRWMSACLRVDRWGDGQVASPLQAPQLRDAVARRELVLNDLDTQTEWDPAALAERMAVSVPTASKDLVRLASEGALRRERRGRRIVYVATGHRWVGSDGVGAADPLQ